MGFDVNFKSNGNFYSIINSKQILKHYLMAGSEKGVP